MLEPGTCRFGKGAESPHLVHHHGVHIRRGNGHFPPAEPDQIRIPGMSPQAQPLFTARSTVFFITEGSPAWNPQAMLAEVTRGRTLSSIPIL